MEADHTADTNFPAATARVYQMPIDTSSAPLQDFDFALLKSPDFKEDSVREDIIMPILTALGYSSQGDYKLQRSKQLLHPFLRVGSSDRPITLIPDYLLSTNGNYVLALDAKAPRENIQTGRNVEQVYSYAIHPEIRVASFALCNGFEFSLFHIQQEQPILSFDLTQLDSYWESLCNHIAPAFLSNHLPTHLRPLLSKLDSGYGNLDSMQAESPQKRPWCRAPKAP